MVLFDPALRHAAEAPVTDLDALSILTVIPKWLPTMDGWDAYWAEFQSAGYNAVHLAPVSERGASDSPYSLRDQLRLAPDLFPPHVGPSDSEREAFAKQTLDRLQAQYGIYGFVDVVWNHTASDSPWLNQHPEAGYNLETAPHLESAYVVDRALIRFSEDHARYGVPGMIRSEQEVQYAVAQFEKQVLPTIKLWEFYALDVAAERARLLKALQASATPVDASQLDAARGAIASLNKAESIERFRTSCVKKEGWSRGCRQLVLDQAVIFCVLHHIASEDDITALLNDVNVAYYREYDDDVKTILVNTANRAKYLRVEPHGPLLGTLSASAPISDTYFTLLTDPAVPERQRMLANNGWIWDADPLINFASASSKAYVRREVIAWGDCVKLRYGNGPEDNPWLWQHQVAYTQKMASLFHGFRIDNCHTTPLHVGAHLLDAARRVNPNLYVFAELFTGNAERDQMFVQELGIHSLIREGMNAKSAEALADHVSKYSAENDVVLATDAHYMTRIAASLGGAVVTPTARNLHCIFMDCTHDNHMPAEEFTPGHSLPHAAVIGMTAAAVGSVLGYDQVFPKLLDLVNEKTRKYPLNAMAMGPARRVMNQVHARACRENYARVSVHARNGFVLIERHNLLTNASFLLVARTQYSRAGLAPAVLSAMDLPELNGHLEFMYAASLDTKQASATGPQTPPGSAPTGYFGVVPMAFAEYPDQCPDWISFSDGRLEITETFNKAGIVLFHITRPANDAIPDADSAAAPLAQAVAALGLEELNIALYRGDGEERDATGMETYDVPGAGRFEYAGMQGLYDAIRRIVKYNDDGHAPLVWNVRNGHWLLDWMHGRLTPYAERWPTIRPYMAWLKGETQRLQTTMSHNLCFMGLARLVMLVTHVLHRRVYALTEQAAAVARGGDYTTLVRACLLTAVQLSGASASAQLARPEFWAAMAGTIPAELTKASLAAGLPHFSGSFMRCWGRDIFIAIPGLFLVPGYYDRARTHLLAFAATVRHGQIPNLLDSGWNCRYNARDAAWWWLQCLQMYCERAPEGLALLGVAVPRRFPGDGGVRTDTGIEPAQAFTTRNTVAEIVYEILERHRRGVHFREYRAGPQLDSSMSHEGFELHIGTDPETGFVYGGSRHNCGTWMDKMGSSEKAGNRGIPATSRHGADVEIVGLSASTLRWITTKVIGHTPHWPWTDVVLPDGATVPLTAWYEQIKSHFEPHFFIPASGPDHTGREDLIRQRTIYKDVVMCKDDPEQEFCFRPNLFVSMYLAPELFDPQHAWQCLQLGRAQLAGPLGARTLTPLHPKYRGYYNNSDDGTDMSVAQGWNYHQGPEWVWVMGAFLRAYWRFGYERQTDSAIRAETQAYVRERLRAYAEFFATIPLYAGLPELTNRDGTFCSGSCPSQAWSTGLILEVLELVRAS
ncbi:hypothetical protein CXG81DRAFT_8863 [Caulochytrium protostelioides]|uniref:Glycogen debranching enzyme n=1 Tax=Caulochytrium protostelioides TaxID=1555241 RepID=A0A4P9XEI9_9FUNG|nr:hypothetical protein CXG81DRAFT_8863 [Caulochytrium protostelioides]|eukprot:RKP03966.1 hypothetical protein CXG81DRAFT_8863 [Caulochytrium protostelioides]